MGFIKEWNESLASICNKQSFVQWVGNVLGRTGSLNKVPGYIWSRKEMDFPCYCSK
ncbi:hypothetical protein RHMOL_Rhmol01G0241800 [Rhododendron molle]|uniref:Uncharacterized protein n=1 Tax=Rhododendron molle TaxID=49168 RepID=A0ACC0Q692_RHOML|nr:hypothetical protein RHMOL_Rhmol01G0241800 [Rhododendron molle]